MAGVVTDTTRQLHEELAAMPDPVQRRALDRLLDVPPGSRLSDLERWRKGPAPRGSGPSLVKYLDRAAEIGGVGLGRLGAEARVPPRRMAELARYGMTASASLIRRHGDARRLATLVATVRHLEGKSIDDALDLMMSAELLGKAQREADKENARRHPRLARASARLAVAVEALFESDGWGGQGQEPRVSEVWQAIEAIVSRTELRAALAVVTETVPPAGGPDPDDWRAALPARYPAVSGFLKMLPAVIEFGASAEGAPVLAAMRALPDVLAYRSRLPAPLIPGRLIDAGVVSGPWRHLVFGHPVHEDGAVSRHAYAFCVLEQFWRGLKRRDIWAEASTRWRNPQARLLEGAAWEAARDDVLTALGLPGNPAALLAEHSRTLDAAYREVGGRLAVNTEVSVDGDGKIHLTGLKAVEEPPSLTDLRARTTAMLPRVDLPEVLLEVMSWAPELAGAFTAVSGGLSRLGDLPTSVAACLAAHAMNVGYRPVAKKGVPALERSRLSHVFQNYVRPETLAAANAPLVARQGGLPLAQAWGGGLVAAVDGMRFVVPVPAAFARPNKKYFGSKRGMTWLNAMFRAKLQPIQHSTRSPNVNKCRWRWVPDRVRNPSPAFAEAVAAPDIRLNNKSSDATEAEGAGVSGLAGSAALELADGVVHLDAERAVLEAMLQGWARQQRSRFLNEEGTIGPRVAMVRRLVEFTNLYPWQWTPADAEAFIAHLRSPNRARPVAMSTGRGYETTLALFMAFITDGRYGWAAECLKRFGQAPQQVFHEDNRVAHVAEYEGQPGRRPLTYDEVQALFDAADGRVEEARSRGRKGALTAMRDSALLKTVYAFGLRRNESRMLDLADLRRAQKRPQYGGYGALHVRYGKASNGSPPRRRTVLTVQEFDWVVDVLRHWVTEVRPAFSPGSLPALFVTERASRMSLRTVNKAFSDARDAAGLPGELDLHCLRHSMITHLVEFVYPEKFVSLQAGHSYASTTAIYTGVSDEYRNRVIQRALKDRHPELWDAE